MYQIALNASSKVDAIIEVVDSMWIDEGRKSILNLLMMLDIISIQNCIQ